jgi:putative membrane protein
MFKPRSPRETVRLHARIATIVGLPSEPVRTYLHRAEGYSRLRMDVWAALLAATSRSLRFSNRAYTCMFVFFVLHAVGAHYTYSEVPWREWLHLQDAAAGPGPANRNNYDRFVHFSYGLLVLPAVCELMQARMSPRGIWVWLMPVFFVMSHSVIYETVEWLAAEVFGGELGAAYLGTQGDEWDAQRDMTCAFGGAVFALLATAVYRRATGREPWVLFAPHGGRRRRVRRSA